MRICGAVNAETKYCCSSKYRYGLIKFFDGSICARKEVLKSRLLVARIHGESAERDTDRAFPVIGTSVATKANGRISIVDIVMSVAYGLLRKGTFWRAYPLGKVGSFVPGTMSF